MTATDADASTPTKIATRQTGATEKRTGFGGESRACIAHILGGIAMLAAGTALLFVVS